MKLKDRALKRRVLLAAGLAMPLAGCLRGANIRVEGFLPNPTFHFRTAGMLPTRLGFPGSLSVREMDAPNGKSAYRPSPMWHVTAERFAADLPDVFYIEYGRVPPGGVEERPAEPLREGVLYTLALSGMGYIGGAIFGQVGRDLSVFQGLGDARMAEAREWMNLKFRGSTPARG